MKKLEIRRYSAKTNSQGKDREMYGIFFSDDNGMSVLSKSPYAGVLEKRLWYFQYMLNKGILLEPDESEMKY